MKKILLILWLLMYTQSFWVVSACESNSCSIADAPAEVLTEYITDLSKITNNVSSAARNSAVDKWTLGKVRAQTLRITNATAGFEWYFSSFDYYLAYPITNNIPYQIERDHRLLMSQNKRLLNKIKTILRSGAWNIVIDKACDGVKASTCNFDWQTAENILAALLKNHKRIIYSYQGVVLWNRNLNRNNLVLVEPGFIEALQDSYGPENAEKCSLCEDAFGSRINKSIDNIGKLNEDSNAAVNKWKYAWAVLTGNEESAEVFLTRTGTWSRKDFYTESRWLWEENVLSRYLWETWAGARTSEIVLGNLKRYNDTNNWSLLNKGNLNTSNPLENTLRNTLSDTQNPWSIAYQVDLFEESILQSYESEGEEKPTIPIWELEEIQTNLEISREISDRVWALHAMQASMNITQDTSATKLKAKIITMHKSLTSAINTLNETRGKSEKVCDAQWKWIWKCVYR